MCGAFCLLWVTLMGRGVPRAPRVFSKSGGCGTEPGRCRRSMGGLSSVSELFQNIFELIAEKYGNDDRRCFISSEAALIPDIRRRFPEKVRMLIDGLQYAA